MYSSTRDPQIPYIWMTWNWKCCSFGTTYNLSRAGLELQNVTTVGCPFFQQVLQSFNKLSQRAKQFHRLEKCSLSSHLDLFFQDSSGRNVFLLLFCLSCSSSSVTQNTMSDLIINNNSDHHITVPIQMARKYGVYPFWDKPMVTRRVCPESEVPKTCQMHVVGTSGVSSTDNRRIGARSRWWRWASGTGTGITRTSWGGGSCACHCGRGQGGFCCSADGHGGGDGVAQVQDNLLRGGDGRCNRNLPRRNAALWNFQKFAGG